MVVEHITLSQAKKLSVGDVIYEIETRNPYTITSVKVWKREPNRIRIRLRRDKKCYEITEDDLHEISL